LRKTQECIIFPQNFRGCGLRKNIGNRKDDSVEIVITSEALGIGLKEGPFTLKEFDESDNSAVRGLSFTLPKNVEAGTYGVTLDVMFNDGKNRASMVGGYC